MKIEVIARIYIEIPDEEEADIFDIDILVPKNSVCVKEIGCGEYSDSKHTITKIQVEQIIDVTDYPTIHKNILI